MKKSLNPSSASIIGSYDLMNGSIVAFAMVFLLSNDLSEFYIGNLIASGNILASLTQPILSNWADRSKTKPIYFFLLIILIPLILALTGVLSFRNNFVLLTVFYVISLALLAVLLPFHNSLIMYLINNGYNINYGSIRSMGSLAYAVTSFVVGLLIERLGTNSVIYYGIAGWLLYLISVSYVHFRYAKNVQSDPALMSDAQVGEDLGLLFIFKYDNFKWLMLGAFINFIAFNIINMFMFQIMENVGGNTQDMGMAFSLAALVEIPSMNLYSRVSKKIPHGQALRISSFFFLIQVFLVARANSVYGVFMGQSLQALAFAVYIVSVVYYTNELMDGLDKVKGQSYITMSQTIGSVVAASLGGFIIDRFSINHALWFAVVCAFIGMLSFNKGLRHVKHPDKRI